MKKLRFTEKQIMAIFDNWRFSVPILRFSLYDEGNS